ncbi:helix-turn-helix protein [Herbihabitans rhizosphaerae]|uniref:Helix-turn-helix protein n=1 Tax=Herbihabitans rhizosphaerae TaxID=1872711 RepID=A0A4Q7L5A9_9PSEU|nr:helix-turn-helix domain-containing protein [Herbihabitans rhizosphaerae]RZS44487.1 helix-turn-helix protein [Herbihabitans rhizosphaerae]
MAHAEPGGSPPLKSLSEQLNRLFEVRRPAERPDRPHTNRDVVTACKAAGWELSESHLSELRRGVKANPTLRTLRAIADFFEVPVGYFTDPAVAEEVERDLAEAERRLRSTLAAQQRAQDDLRAAVHELQQALRDSGVTKTAHRNAAGDARAAREQASMMRALARALTSEDERADKPDA